jgi:hypothetical protein
MFLMPGATGLDMPPFELHSDDSPNLDGSMYRGTRAASRPVMLPIYVHGIDRITLRQFKRKLARALSPRNGYCVLKFVESDGVARYLKCYYTGGMEGNESSNGFTWVSYGLQLNAMDPWFYGDNVVQNAWTFGSAQALLGPKFLPLTISKGVMANSSVTLTNPGDIEAWPVWSISGPLRSLQLIGPDGTSFGIPANTDGTDVIKAGRTLTVDTRPGFKTLVDDQGTNYFPKVSANPVLWSVPIGTSTATINAVAGAGSASVSVALSPRYASY